MALAGQRSAGPASSMGLYGPADLGFSSVLLAAGRGWPSGDERSRILVIGRCLVVTGSALGASTGQIQPLGQLCASLEPTAG